MSISAPSSKPPTLPWQRFLKKSWSLALGARPRPRHERAGARMGPDDVAAVYLVLLAREPEAEAIYRDRSGRPASALMADILGSGEFSERILPALLAPRALPHEALPYSQLGRALAWLERSGIGRAGAAGGWAEILAVLFSQAPVKDLAARILPQHAARLAEAAAGVLRAPQPLQAPAEASDVRALHLVLLGRPPEGAAAGGGRGRRLDDLVAETLASPEFREHVLLPLLLDLPLPQHQASPAELGLGRAWLSGIGVPPAGVDADWLELFATLVLSEPVARLAAVVLPAYAARLQQQARRLMAAASGRAPLSDADVEAIYLLLLGRRPEGEGVYRDRRGRPRAQLVADILGSPEFRLGVLPAVRGEAPVPPAVAPGRPELAIVIEWVAKTGAPLGPPVRDWHGAAAAFLGSEPARSLAAAVLPQEEHLLREFRQAGERSPAERTAFEQVERLHAALDAIDGRLKDLEAGWRQHLPAFLNAASSVGAFAHRQAGLLREVEALRGRLDAAKKAAD